MNAFHKTLLISLLLVGNAGVALGAAQGAKPPAPPLKWEKILRQPLDNTSDIAFSRDGKRVFAGGAHIEVLKVWDVETLNLIREVDRGESVESVAVSRDDKLLAAGNHEGFLTVWDQATWRVVFRTKAHSEFVSALAFTPDGRYLISAGLDSKVKVWDPKSGTLVKTLTASDEVRTVTVSPDGSLLAVAGFNNTHLWRINGWVERPFPKWHEGVVWSIAFSPDGKTLATSRIREVVLWDVRTRKRLRSMNFPLAFIWSIAFSPDGSRLAVGLSYGSASLWDPRTGKKVAQYPRADSDIRRVAFSPDGRYLATAEASGHLRFWRY